MYTIWFCIPMDSQYLHIDCPDIPRAQDIWDRLLKGGFEMRCQRP